MPEAVKKRKKPESLGFGMEEAKVLLGMSARNIHRHIEEAKKGKAEIPIPYIQVVPRGRITFEGEDALRLWQHNRTNGIKPCTKAKNRMRIVG